MEPDFTAAKMRVIHRLRRMGHNELLNGTLSLDILYRRRRWAAAEVRLGIAEKKYKERKLREGITRALGRMHKKQDSLREIVRSYDDRVYMFNAEGNQQSARRLRVKIANYQKAINRLADCYV